MVGDNGYKKRMLVVEDDSLWHEDMKSALKGRNINADFVETGEEAEDYLNKKHYHMVSLDQKIPRSKGGAVSIDIGTELTRFVVDHYPLSDLVIYTGYDKIEIGYGARSGDDVIRKNEPGQTEGNPEDWASKVGSRLNKHFDFYFREAGDVLPPHLSSVAAFFHQHLDGNAWARCMADATKFWTLTLRLALAQAQALSRRFNLRPAVANQDRYQAIEEALGSMFSRFTTDQLDPWRPYIGAGGIKGGMGRRFLERGSKPFRKLRNRVAHDTTLTPEKALFDEMRDPLFHLMDAAAFWASYPLVSGIRQQDHGYQGDYLQGSRYPCPRRELLAREGSRFDPDHVYLQWRDEHGEVDWVDLYPFVHAEYDEKLGRSVIWVLGNHWQGRWYRCSLQTGKSAPWREIPTEAREILALE